MGEHRTTIIIAFSVAAVLGLIGVWAFISSGQQQAAPITAEITDQGTIQNNVQLSHLSIATSENFARQKIYVISGNLKNVADRPLRAAEVKMTFTDFDGKAILEYSQSILNVRQKPVLPGEEFRFEVRQENLPRGWNYRVPITELTKLGY